MNDMLEQYLDIEHPMGIIIYTRNSTAHRIVGNVVDVSDEAFMIDDIFDDTLIFALDSISAIKFEDLESDYATNPDGSMQEATVWLQLEI